MNCAVTAQVRQPLVSTTMRHLLSAGAGSEINIRTKYNLPYFFAANSKAGEISYYLGLEESKIATCNLYNLFRN